MKQATGDEKKAPKDFDQGREGRAGEVCSYFE